jgi:CDP-diacylglycerol--glycerol-3-phosphate 3-phosphatidyltransferase
VLSAVRVALIPLIVFLLLRETSSASWAAFVVFLVGALTDIADGYLARRHAMTTPTGAWLDPLSDKLFVAVPAIVLSMQGAFPWWATVVIIAREIAVTLLRWRLDRTGGVSMPASRIAKAKTGFQLSALALTIAPLGDAWDPVVLGVTVAAVALTVYSGAEYFLTSRHRVEAG